MERVLKDYGNFADYCVNDRLQLLEIYIRALNIPDFNIFATLVQNTVRHILSTYCEDYNLYEENIFYFAGLFSNDVNREAKILDFPRSIFAIGEQIALIENEKQKLSNVPIFEEVVERFKMLMKLFQDAIYFAQFYQKEISYSSNSLVTVAYEGVKQFKEDIVKMLPALKQQTHINNVKAGDNKEQPWDDKNPDYMQLSEAIEKFAPKGIRAPSLSDMSRKIKAGGPTRYMRKRGVGCRVHIVDFLQYLKKRYPEQEFANDIADEVLADREAMKEQIHRQNTGK